MFCIREREDQPQLIATSRHISCGGYEIRDVSWNARVLSGTSDLVAGDSYTIYILEPVAYEFQGADCDGATVAGTVKRGLVREVTLKSDTSATFSWRIRF